MKKTKKTAIIAISIAAIIAIGVTIIYINFYINTRNATSISITYVHNESKIKDELIETNDTIELKNFLKGFCFYDIPSCGFSEDIYLKINIGNNELLLYPACDGCNKFKVGDTNKYLFVNESDYSKIRAILEKYQMKFPCI